MVIQLVEMTLTVEDDVADVHEPLNVLQQSRLEC